MEMTEVAHSLLLYSLTEAANAMNSHDSERRHSAEEHLNAVKRDRGYTEALLEGTLTGDLPTRQMFATLFRRLCRQGPKFVNLACFHRATELYLVEQHLPIADCLLDAVSILIGYNLQNPAYPAYLCQLLHQIRADNAQRTLKLINSTLMESTGSRSHYRESLCAAIQPRLLQILPHVPERLLFLLFKCFKSLASASPERMGIEQTVVVGWLDMTSQKYDLPNRQVIFEEVAATLILVMMQPEPQIDSIRIVLTYICRKIHAGWKKCSQRVVLELVRVLKNIYDQLEKRQQCAKWRELIVEGREACQHIGAWLLKVLEECQPDNFSLQREMVAFLRRFPATIGSNSQSLIIQLSQAFYAAYHEFREDQEFNNNKRVLVYCLLSSVQDVLWGQIDYQRIVQEACLRDILRNNQQVLNACLQLLTSYIKRVTSKQTKERLAECIIHALLKLVEHNQPDSIKISTNMAFLSLCRWRISTEFSQLVASTCLDSLARFESREERVTMLRCIQKLHERAWDCVEAELNTLLASRLYNMTMSPLMPEEAELFVGMLNIFTRSLNISLYFDTYLFIIMSYCRAEDEFGLAEPSLKLLDALVLTQRFQKGSELPQLLRRFDSIIHVHPRLIIKCCRVLVKLCSVGLYLNEVVHISKTAIAGIEAVSRQDSPWIVVIEMLSIRNSDFVVDAILADLIALDARNTKEVQSLQTISIKILICRLILRSNNPTLILNYEPTIDYTDSSLIILDLAVMHEYLTRQQQMRATTISQIATLVGGLSLNQRPVGEVEGHLNSIVNVLKKVGVLFGKHWLLRNEALGCSHLPIVKQMTQHDPLWEVLRLWNEPDAWMELEWEDA